MELDEKWHSSEDLSGCAQESFTEASAEYSVDLARAYLRLREALEWYAIDTHYLRGMPGERITAEQARTEGTTLGIPLWKQDDGKRARDALKEGGMNIYLFAYGKLQPGYSPPDSLKASAPDAIRGDLWVLRGDPLVLNVGSGGVVHGTLMEIEESELHSLDKEEVGYSRVPVITSRGKAAYAYQWAGAMPKDAKQIDSWPDSSNP